MLKISTITKDDFNNLKLKLVPSIPISIFRRLLKNGEDLVKWKEDFIQFYGEEGHLNDRNLIVGNEKYTEDLISYNTYYLHNLSNSIYS